MEATSVIISSILKQYKNPLIALGIIFILILILKWYQSINDKLSKIK